MELVYAALLLHSMKKPIDETHVKKIVEAAGGEVDSARIKALVGSLHGVNIDEAIKQAAVTAVAAPAASGSHEKAEEKKEESAEDQEKKAEEAAGGLSSLFG
jgi:large subunit ribosomal protein L12